MRGLFVAGCLLAAVPAAAQSPADAAAITATVNSFHEALKRGDAATSLRLLAPDAVILESGARETLEEYRAHHLPEDIRFAQAVPAQRSAIQVTVNGDVAWASSTSVSKGTWKDRPVEVRGAELMVLSRTPAGWIIRAIHWSSR